MEMLKDWMKDRDKGVRVLVTGDFNAKTGREEEE